MKTNIMLTAILMVLSLNINAKNYNSSDFFPKSGLGQLKHVEDAGYPMVIVTIELAQGGVQDYEINLETLKNVNAGTLSSWIGKEVGFDYKNTVEKLVLDIKQNGKSILDDGQIEVTKEAKKITGVLKGAKQVTQSDLPSQISVTDANNKVVTFDYYVTQKMTKANGMTVTAYYEEQGQNTITNMWLSKDNNSSSDELKAMGLLKEVDDSGYPLAYLTVEFPEKNATEYFDIDFSALKSVNINTLRKWKGRYVQFTYSEAPENALLDIRKNGKSLFGENQELPTGIIKISGTLSGATEETPGDLPGSVTITTKNNEMFTFDFFISSEMVKANNTTVTAYYEERFKHFITSIKVIPQ